MPIRRIEELEAKSGRGEVHHKEDGSLVGKADYSFVVLQEIIGASSMSDSNAELPGLTRIEGHIDGLDTISLVTERKMLTLTLTDGRRVDFVVTDRCGNFQGSGDFY